MRSKPPTAEEIARQAKQARLLPKRAATLEHESVAFEVIPTKVTGKRSMEDLEDGQVVGVVRRQRAGEQVGGRLEEHNVFLAKVDGAWKVYAQSGDEVTEQEGEAKLDFHYWGKEKVQRARLAKRAPKSGPECILIPICWTVCLVSVFGYCLVSVPVCVWICI